MRIRQHDSCRGSCCRWWRAWRAPTSGAVVTSVVGFGFALMRNAETSGRHGLETVIADRMATRFAGSVRAVVQPVKSAIDVGQLRLDLFEDGEVLLPFEGLGTDVSGVLRQV